MSHRKPLTPEEIKSKQNSDSKHSGPADLRRKAIENSLVKGNKRSLFEEKGQSFEAKARREIAEAKARDDQQVQEERDKIKKTIADGRAPK